MKISKHLKTVALLSTSITLLLLANHYSLKQEKPLINISKQDSTFNLKFNTWNYVNLGQKRLISSLYWIATILESDHDHYKKKDLNSWMFLRFKTISELEPKFLQNYNFGGTYLSIIKDDIPGASYIFDKGLSEYPKDFNLMYAAAFHYRFEANDQERARSLLKTLSENGKIPKHLIGSFVKLESDENPMEAFAIISDIQKQFDQNSFMFIQIENYKYALKAKHDLECLNNKMNNCSLYDLDGIKYIYKNGKFDAIKDWEYTLKNKGSKKLGADN